MCRRRCVDPAASKIKPVCTPDDSAVEKIDVFGRTLYTNHWEDGQMKKNDKKKKKRREGGKGSHGSDGWHGLSMLDYF